MPSNYKRFAVLTKMIPIAICPVIWLIEFTCPDPYCSNIQCFVIGVQITLFAVSLIIDSMIRKNKLKLKEYLQKKRKEYENKRIIDLSDENENTDESEEENEDESEDA